MPDPFDMVNLISIFSTSQAPLPRQSVSQVQRKPAHPDRVDAFSRVEKYRPNPSPGRNADVLVGISNSHR